MAVLTVAVVLAFGLYDPERRVGPLPPPSTEDARYTKVVLQTLEDIGRQPDRVGELGGTVEEINGLLRILARSHPEIAGQVAVEGEAVRLDVSVLVPGAPWLGWVNASALVPQYRGTLELRELRLGRLPLPPGPSLDLTRWAIDRRMGAGTAEQLFGMLPGMRLEDERIWLDIDLPVGSDRRLSRSAVTELYGRDMPTRTEVGEFVAAFDAGVADRSLPVEGSFLPWLTLTLERAADLAEREDDPGRILLAGFMALNYLCGSDHFRRVMLPPRADDEEHFTRTGPGCRNAALRGRVDLRRHFLTAATIQLMSTRSLAVTAGEAKELYDMRFSGGYDFTDVAANNSGIRLAELISALDAEGLRALSRSIAEEGDVMIDLFGIPGALPPSAFRLRFGEVDSPHYRAMMAEIEARIDALPIHRAARAAQDG